MGHLILIGSFLICVVIVNAEYNCQYKKDGFYTDLEFCHVYWRCNYGIPEEYECPAGTAWNHLDLRCDWLDMVDCTRGGTVTQKPEETEAPETEEPETDDPETDEPETEEPETTKPKITVTKKNEKTKVQTTTESTTDDKNTFDSLSSLESTGPKIAAIGSVAEPKVTEFLMIEPEPLIGDIISTNESLILDSESLPSVSESIQLVSETVAILSTEAPVNELLVQTTTIPITTTTIASTKKQKTTKKISSNEERKKFEYDTLCNGLLASTGFVSDPFICNKYLRCNHGVAERFTCASGTLWNSADKMCTWPALVDCDDREVFTDGELVKEEAGGSSSASQEDSESAESSSEASSSAEKPTANSKETSSTEVASSESGDSETEDEKPAKPIKNKNRPSSTRSLLTRKKKNGANVRELEFKETTATTPIPSTSASVTATQATNNGSGLCQAIGTYHLPDNSNCAAYYMCNMGKETHITCPDRQLFNAETAQCEDFQLVFCGSRPVNHADKNQCASKRDGIYPDIERACRIFFQCVSQQKVREATCPSNLKFNSLTGRCDNPANVMAPCGTYNVTLGSGSSTSGSDSINKLINWSKYLAALITTKLTLSRLI